MRSRAIELIKYEKKNSVEQRSQQKLELNILDREYDYKP